MNDQSLNSLQADSAIELLVAGLFDYAPLKTGAKGDIWQALSRAFAVANEITWPLIGNDISLAVENVALINHQALTTHRLPTNKELFICAQGAPLGSRLTSISQDRFDELNCIQLFNQQNIAGHSPLRVTSYEFMISAEAQTDPTELKVALRNIVAFLFEDNVRVCIEPELTDASSLARLPVMFEVAEEVSHRVAGPALTVKLNLEAGSPCCDKALAQAINDAAVYGVELKLCVTDLPLFTTTQRKRQVPGLINLSLAHCLCRDPEVADFDAEKVYACIGAGDPASFYLNQIAAWENYRLDLHKLASLREACPLSLEVPDLITLDKLLSTAFGPRA